MRMKKITAVLMLFLLTLMTLLGPNSVFAAQRTLGIIRYPQEKSQWCWAACAQTVGQYITNVKKTQSNICSYVKGAVVNLPESLGGTRNAVKYTTGKETGAITSCLSLSSSQGYINKNRPIVSYLKWNNGGAHFVVIYGYSDSKLGVSDPSANISGSGQKYYEYSSMIKSNTFQSGTGAWTQTIYLAS